jgi:DNA polymerase/3'-5' exonuclease PolX
MPFAEAYVIATHFADLIRDTTDRLVIAGSLRRRTNTVGDVELVCLPKIETVRSVTPGLFEDVVTECQVDRLHERMEALLTDGIVSKRPRSDGALFWGPRAKYLVFEGAPVDLFCVVNDWRTKEAPTAQPDRWGLILAIRTGPWQFSNQLVTPRSQRTREGGVGLLPDHLRVQEGWLTYRTSGERIATPEEESVFELLGLRWREPEER